MEKKANLLSFRLLYEVKMGYFQLIDAQGHTNAHISDLYDWKAAFLCLLAI